MFFRIVVFCLVSTALSTAAWSATIHVPEDHAKIQDAIDAASEGDTVIVAPGVYKDSIELNKTITLASNYIESGDIADIENTILDGDRLIGRADYVLKVHENVGLEARLVGFTIRNGDDGVTCDGEIVIEHNHFIRNTDAIDYEAGGGVCRDNLFQNNRDDALDLDGPTGGVFERNFIQDCEDDGIEIRLHPFEGDPLEILIRDNLILGSGEDGIQVIDYDGVSSRTMRFERNVIARSKQAGLGLMDNGDTKEDYRGAAIPEPIFLINNTIADSEYGISGGGNLTAVNNIIVNSRVVGLWKISSDATVKNNLFYRNAKHWKNSDAEAIDSLIDDPKLGPGWVPLEGSPAIDAGMNPEDLEAWPGAEFAFDGDAPDIGAKEFVKEIDKGE